MLSRCDEGHYNSTTMSRPEVPTAEFEDDIEWGEEELEDPSCDLSNPDYCDSCQ